MVKLIVFVTLVTLSIAVNGQFFVPGLNLFRGDPFPEPKSDTPVPSNVVLNTITQQLDNFDPVNDATWQQQYYSNDEFYQPGGPIFVFLAGEWDITPYRLTESLMAQLAQQLNGNIFYLEHRYYGQSRPVPDTSLANLRFLTVDQALADVAHFVSFVTSEAVSPGAGPVIVTGGHYSASLAVWFRQKYPHLAYGAWASSAPLQALINHRSYKELAGGVYRAFGGEDCYSTIQDGFAAIERYLDEGRADYLEDAFSTCTPVSNEADRQIFMSIVSEIFAVVPQVNHIYSVLGVCDLITNGTAESEVHRIARHVDAVLGEFTDIGCLPVNYTEIIELDRDTDWDSPSNDLGLRPYSYQLCTQLGWFHSSDSPFQPFGTSFNHTFFYPACRDVFGESFTEASIDENVLRFNTAYGEFNPSVTNVIFVHGELDPWRTVGVQSTLNPSSPAIIIRGGSQGNDLGPLTDEDSENLVAAKNTISGIITQWVADAASDLRK